MPSKNLTFQTIYSQYYGRIVAYLARSVGSDAAEDYAQDVFLKVYSSLDGFDHKSSIYTWIYRIATNHLIDTLRKKKNSIKQCNLSDKTLFQKTDFHYLTEEFRIVENEMKECLCSYIKKLPPKYRAILILKEYESMSTEEIMEILDLSKENVKKTLARARAKLRALLHHQCDFYFNEANQFSCEKKVSPPGPRPRLNE